jgi:hypothetical protein
MSPLRIALLRLILAAPKLHQAGGAIVVVRKFALSVCFNHVMLSPDDVFQLLTGVLLE